jgi:hypothetical protein
VHDTDLQYWVTLVQWHVCWSWHCRLDKFYALFYAPVCPEVFCNQQSVLVKDGHMCFRNWATDVSLAYSKQW